EQGWCCAVAFVIQVEGITEVRPNTETHPAFGDALAAAATAGVRMLHRRRLRYQRGHQQRHAGGECGQLYEAARRRRYRHHPRP
ncbi:MAG: DNA/RNA nuclease SfsA, partial [Oscillospiraceae bacterium]|nr:DNA/RNA nuclease SfsA [Oscillospiraceae bacterium]